jgi:hypothetical protein
MPESATQPTKYPAVKERAKIFEAVNPTAFTDREPGFRARLN